MKVVSSGGKDAPLKAVSMVNIQDFYQFLIWNECFLCQFMDFRLSNFQKYFCFINGLLLTFETLHLNHIFCKCHTVKMCPCIFCDRLRDKFLH